MSKKVISISELINKIDKHYINNDSLSISIEKKSKTHFSGTINNGVFKLKNSENQQESRSF